MPAGPHSVKAALSFSPAVRESLAKMLIPPTHCPRFPYGENGFQRPHYLSINLVLGEESAEVDYDGDSEDGGDDC